jgi:membrane-associated phospholipid phosphatase
MASSAAVLRLTWHWDWIFKQALKYYIRYGFFTLLVFFPLFYGSNYLGSRSSVKYHLYWEWEKKIPYVPAFFIIYYGIFLLPLFIPWLIKDKAEVKLLTLKMILAITVASIIFVLLPCVNGYPPLPENNLTDFANLVTGTYNLFPSLHVCLTLIIVHAFLKHLPLAAKAILIFTTLLLISSTLFTHRHHLADVAGGLLLAQIIIILAKYLKRELTNRSK